MLLKGKKINNFKMSDYGNMLEISKRFLEPENMQNQNQTNNAEIYLQLMQCFQDLKNHSSLDPQQLMACIHFILNNFSCLDVDDPFDILDSVLEVSLNFQNIEIASQAIHLLSMLTSNPDNQNIFQEARLLFSQKADIQFLLSLCDADFTIQVKNFLLSFVCFSDETLNIAKESGILYKLIVTKPLTQDASLMMNYLHFLFSISRRIGNDEIQGYIYHRVTQIITLEDERIFSFCVNIFRAIFEKYQQIDLYKDFFQKYAPKIFLETPKSNLLTLHFLCILESLSSNDFIDEFLNNFPLFNYIKPYFNQKINTSVDPQLDSLYWEIVSNFIYCRPKQALYSIELGISQHALLVLEQGTMKMKNNAVSYLASLYYSIQDEGVRKYIIEIHLTECLLVIIDSVDDDSAKEIIQAISSIFIGNKITYSQKLEIAYEAESQTVLNALEDFIDLHKNDGMTYYFATEIFKFIDHQTYEEESDSE